MTVFKSVMAACLMAVLFASCGGDSKEKLLSDSKSMMKEMLEIVKSMKDEASVKSAEPKFAALVKKGKDMDARIKALNLDKKALDEEAKKDGEFQELKKELETALKEVSKVKGAAELFMKSMTEM